MFNGLCLKKRLEKEKKKQFRFYLVPARDVELKYHDSASLFALLFHNLFKFLFVVTCDSG